MTNKKNLFPCRKFATEKSRYVVGFDFFSTFWKIYFGCCRYFCFHCSHWTLATSTTKANDNNWTTTTATATTKYTSEPLQGSMVRWPNVSFWAFPDFLSSFSLLPWVLNRGCVYPKGNSKRVLGVTEVKYVKLCNLFLDRKWFI